MAAEAGCIMSGLSISAISIAVVSMCPILSDVRAVSHRGHAPYVQPPIATDNAFTSCVILMQ